MPKRPIRSGSRSPRAAPAAASPVLAALEALGFAFGRTLRAAAPAPAPEPPKASKAPRRRRALKAVAAKARAVAKAAKRTAAKLPKEKPAKAARRKRHTQAFAAGPAAVPVVAAKPPLIRRKVVKPTRPATNSVNAPALDADAGPTPALDPGLGPVRGARVFFRHEGAITEGEVVRVTPDGSLVVMPLPAGDRLLLTPADLVPPLEPQP